MPIRQPILETKRDGYFRRNPRNAQWTLPYCERGVHDRSLLRRFIGADWSDLDPDDAERRLSRYLAMSQTDPTIDHDMQLGRREVEEFGEDAWRAYEDAERRRAAVVDMLATCPPVDEYRWQGELEKIENDLESLWI